MPAPRAAALFLDRDDTLVRDAGYMSRPEQIELLPGVAEALRAARDAGLRIYLVTNQSGINRGFYTLADAEACNRRLEALVFDPAANEPSNLQAFKPSNAARPRGFDGVCIAPERPDEPSRYRKPSPAYLLERIAAEGLDPAACRIPAPRRRRLRRRARHPRLPLLPGVRLRPAFPNPGLPHAAVNCLAWCFRVECAA